jgi:hypothetical protein
MAEARGKLGFRPSRTLLDLIRASPPGGGAAVGRSRLPHGRVAPAPPPLGLVGWWRGSLVWG